MKRSRTKKLLSSISILLLAAMLLASCSSDGAPDTDQTSSATESTSASTSEDVTTVRAHEVPDDLDFDGGEFNMLYPEWQGYSYYFFADDFNGEIMNDAIYDRTMKIEQFLNVDMKHTDAGGTIEVWKEIKKLALANDSTYSYALLHCFYGAADLSSGGCLYNWDDLEYVDFTADWWNRPLMDDMKLGEGTYFGINDFMIPCPYTIYINKDMASDYNLDDAYRLVFDGAWTVDKFFEMAEAVVTDLNGDGVMGIEDQYGMTTNENSKYGNFISTSGHKVTIKDSDGRITFDFNTPKIQTLVDKFADAATRDIIYFGSSNTVSGMNAFRNGNTLFLLLQVAYATLLRDVEMDFGMLPYPKYDEDQEDYISPDWGGLCCIPISIENPELVGAVSELLAFESGNNVIPTYYEELLQGKLSRDENTVKMLDIMFDTLSYEPLRNYFGNSGESKELAEMIGIIGSLAVNAKSTDVSSWLATREKAAQGIIDNYYEVLENFENQ